MEHPSQKLVQEYLFATGERRMDEAASYLADDVVLVFPQGRFNDLAAMTAAMAGRYQSVSKAYDSWDVVEHERVSVVITTGRLSGTNIHGIDFTNIRFCDRFVLSDGRISEQHVWNDLAESGVLDEMQEP